MPHRLNAKKDGRMSAKHWVSVLSTAVLIVGCGSREQAAPPQAQAEPAAAEPAAAAAAENPAVITFTTAGTVPEGVEYDTKNQRFLVGSLSKGTVFVVAADGTLSPFIQDADLKSSVGIEVDEERNRLLVANSDSAVFSGKSAGQAKLGIYNLDSGERIAMVDLAAAGPKEAKAHFANDVTVGDDGSAYVTDSFARVVYKVDASNNVSVLLPNSFGKTKDHMFNGIVFNPAGYLLVAESVSGDLYKVPVADPKKFTKVKVPDSLAGADGLVPHPNGSVIVVRNDDSLSAVALSSSDDWATASPAGKGTFALQATTATVAGDDVYVVHPHFSDANAMPSIEKVALQ
jgi:sugar lactone lactonase YvrE